MIDLAEAREALASLPGFAAGGAAVERLSGGHGARSFLVTRNARRYVLRLAERGPAAVGRDAFIERQVQAHAARHDLAPAIVHADPGGAWLLSEYLPGRAWRERDVADCGRLDALAALLREVHALPLSGTGFDARGAARTYSRLLAARGEQPGLATLCRNIIHDAPRAARVACCHNDLVAGNVIEGDRLRLIDWEFAADNEPLFDLASLIGWHDLDERRIRRLLAAYAGSDDQAWRDRLDVQRRVFDALQWLWLAARGGPRHRLDVVAARLRRGEDARAG